MVRLRAVAGGLALAASAAALNPMRQKFRDSLQALHAQTPGSEFDPSDTNYGYTEHYLQVPVDHFHDNPRYEPHSDASFGLRYFFDAKFYKDGGPVFVLMSGEGNAEARLPYLYKGIAHEIAEATNGLALVLEQRYYGKSNATEDWSIPNLRFQSTEQQLADTAFFAQNVKIPGFEHVDLSPQKTPWIVYGGSYGGAFAAFLRTTYPDIFFGAISSSGTVEPIMAFWQYFEAARIYGPKDCGVMIQKLTNVIDNILIDHKGTEWPDKLKDAFEFSNSTDLQFVNFINSGVFGLQGYNWDPANSDNTFFQFCSYLTSDDIIRNNTESKEDAVKQLLTIGGYGNEVETLTNRMLNYIGYIDNQLAVYCTPDETAVECLYGGGGSGDVQDNPFYPWDYQVCTEWAQFQTSEGTPEGQLPMISRLLDLNQATAFCKDDYNITSLPNIDYILKYGGNNISYPRLAFINGDRDPWRGATVAAIGLPERESTICEPYIVIENATHHWDENGVLDSQKTPDFPPKNVADVKAKEREFVLEWLKEWGTDHQ